MYSIEKRGGLPDQPGTKFLTIRRVWKETREITGGMHHASKNCPVHGPRRDAETYIDQNIDTGLSSREFDGPFHTLSTHDAALPLFQSAIHRLKEAA